MTALTVNAEFGLMRVRFQRTLLVSIALHAALLGALGLAYHLAPEVGEIVEITWLDQPVVAPLVLPPTASELAVGKPLTVREKLAQTAANAEQVRARLRSLKPSPIGSASLVVDAPATADLMAATVATMAPMARPTQTLNRGTEVSVRAAELVRGPAPVRHSAALMGAPQTTSGPAGTQVAIRELGGATLTGLVADREVLEHAMPTYPAWATAEAVEAAVTLYFVVLPDGRVKENVQVRKTAGYRDFDRRALEAIRRWRFVPMTGRSAREQWGTITFRYRLHN